MRSGGETEGVRGRGDEVWSKKEVQREKNMEEWIYE